MWVPCHGKLGVLREAVYSAAAELFATILWGVASRGTRTDRRCCPDWQVVSLGILTCTTVALAIVNELIRISNLLCVTHLFRIVLVNLRQSG
jgi:hypothetical protein